MISVKKIGRYDWPKPCPHKGCNFMATGPARFKQHYEEFPEHKESSTRSLKQKKAEARRAKSKHWYFCSNKDCDFTTNSTHKLQQHYINYPKHKSEKSKRSANSYAYAAGKPLPYPELGYTPQLNESKRKPKNPPKAVIPTVQLEPKLPDTKIELAEPKENPLQFCPCCGYHIKPIMITMETLQ